MAYENIGIDAAAANLGEFLRIVYSDGVRNQISEDFRDWESVTKLKVRDDAARQLNFMIQKTLGASAVQFSKQGSSASFPSSSQSTIQECVATYKELFSTIELEYDLWQRALKTPEKYAEPLAHEINAKGIAQKRVLSAAFHLDGSGTIGKIASGGVGAVSGGQIVLTLDSTAPGGERYFEWEDEVVIYNAAGTQQKASDATTAGNDTVTVYRVVSKDRENNTVTLQNGDNSDAIDGVGTTNPPVATDSIYRKGQVEIPSQSTLFNGSADVGTATEVMAGLESLTAADGRLLHGITMSGSTAGTRYSASSSPLDISHIQKGLDKVKVLVGQGRYKYNQALCSPEALSALIESQETDRRLVSMNDDKRGFKGFGYVHGNDTVAFETSEYCAANRIWILPQGGKESGVLELHGTDFQDVKVGNQSEFLKAASGGGYSPNVQKFMMGYMTVVNKHPAACLALTDFTV